MALKFLLQELEVDSDNIKIKKMIKSVVWVGIDMFVSSDIEKHKLDHHKFYPISI